jgi:hypothetical protein
MGVLKGRPSFGETTSSLLTGGERAGRCPSWHERCKCSLWGGECVPYWGVQGLAGFPLPSREAHFTSRKPCLRKERGANRRRYAEEEASQTQRPDGRALQSCKVLKLSQLQDLILRAWSSSADSQRVLARAVGHFAEPYIFSPT